MQIRSHIYMEKNDTFCLLVVCGCGCGSVGVGVWV